MYYILIASIPDKSMRHMSNRALIKINNDIFINHQINSLLRLNKHAKIIVVCSFESKKILAQTVRHNRVTYIEHQYNEYSNVGQSIKCAIDIIPPNNVISIMNLAMTIDPSIFKQIKPKESSVIINNSKKFQSKIGCTINKDNKIEFVFYDLPHKLCEYLFISKKDHVKFVEIMNKYVKNNMYLFEVINTLLLHNMRIETISTNNNIIHLQSANQLPNIKNLFRKINDAYTI